MKMGDIRTVVLSLFVLFNCCLQDGVGKSLDGKHRKEILAEEEVEHIERPRTNSTRNDQLLSSPNDTLQISLVNGARLDKHRTKRLSFKIARLMWPHRIPYIIAFTDTERRMRLRKVLDRIEDNICVKFISVEGKIDKSDKLWPEEHGFKTDAYLKFQNGGGCVGHYGVGHGTHFRTVSPCYKYLTMMHETMHALGAIHDQKMPLRDKYITVHNDAILKGKLSQYKKVPAERVNSVYFDSASNLLYGRTFFHNSGKPTYDFLRPDMGQLVGERSTLTLFFEMNKNYKCQETFCSDVTIDCGPGYLTFLHDKCVCVCPDQYDPSTNCTTLINKAVGPKSWPNTPFSLYKADECPDGFQEGTIPISGKSPPHQTGPPLPAEGNTLNVKVCTKTTPTKNVTWNDWPLGAVCIGKVVGVDCGLPFVDSSFEMKTTHPHPLEGSVGDVTLDDEHYLTMRFCCYEGAPQRLPMRLPTATSFRLLKTHHECQEVEGMFHVETTIKTHAKTKVHGLKLKPAITAYHTHFTHSSCLYIPPTYGCNKIFTLSSSQKTATFSIPQKGSSREGSRRCFYAFQTSAKSRLRLTFNKFSIHPEDKFYVKRYHPWTNPFRVLSDSRPTQIITERNYLFVEFWSYFKEDSQYEGADLTVDLLLDDEMCYDAELRGSDYAGDKSVTELYEECLPWKEATTCQNFPWEHSLTLLNSDNKCRNLDKLDMLQPWCYVKIEGSQCVRRYCDVCNEADPKDVNDDCNKRLTADPNACSDTTFKNNCFKSCGAFTAPYDKNKGNCSRPQTPKSADVTFQGTLQDSYHLGNKVGVACGDLESHDIECTTHGWAMFDADCYDENCIDASQYCAGALNNFPELCTHRKTSEIANYYCQKTCDNCRPCSVCKD